MRLFYLLYEGILSLRKWIAKPQAKLIHATQEEVLRLQIVFERFGSVVEPEEPRIDEITKPSLLARRINGDDPLPI